ncbi:MAG: prenyltransferase/squalene oxidase repeat-containing protein [Pseudomonadota bacterium]|nr:prenyltransferase/squalene oxidase repeat-containing protein [Pseudomonadota bacterium]
MALLLTGFNFDEKLDQSISNTVKYLKERQRPEGHWAGAYVCDASFDALALALGKKLGLLNEDLKVEIYKSITDRIDPSKSGWTTYAGGPIDRDVTGIILLALQSVGYSEADPHLIRAWQWFHSQGGLKILGPIAKAQLIPLGLVSKKLVPMVTARILGLPKLSPVHISKLGHVKELTIPFIGWQILSELKDNSLSAEFLNLTAWMNEKVSIGTYKFPQIDGTSQEFTKDPYVDLANSFINLLVGGSDIFWAKQVVAYALQRRNPSGNWFGVSFTMVNLLMLSEAQRVGLGDFSGLLNQGWQSILRWRALSGEGISVQQVMSSDIWDTSNTLSAFHKLKDTKWYDSQMVQGINLGAKWLNDKFISSAGWSFDSSDRTLPDLDDTGTVLHALAGTQEVEHIPFALDWILENQNDDGGFPAWNKGVSQNTFLLMEGFFPDIPDIADISQTDLTARVLVTFSVLEKQGVVSRRTLTPIRERACKFILDKSEKIKNIDAPAYTGHWFSNNVYAASTAAMGLVYGNCNQKTLPQILKWVVSVQNLDGGWGEGNGGYKTKEFFRGPSTLSQTTLILLGLVETYGQLKTNGNNIAWLKTSIEKGMDFVMSQSQLGTNYFDPTFTGINIKGASFSRYELLPAYTALYVYGTWLKYLGY